jgi:hypothetical protein
MNPVTMSFHGQKMNMAREDGGRVKVGEVLVRAMTSGRG